MGDRKTLVPIILSMKKWGEPINRIRKPVLKFIDYDSESGVHHWML